MENRSNSSVRKSFSIVVLSILFVVSGSTAISRQPTASLQSLLSAIPSSIEKIIRYSPSPKYSEFELQDYPVLSGFVNRYDTLSDLLANMEKDFDLSYDLSGDQNFYGQLSFNESPLTLLTKAAEKKDSTYQCFERAELVALWAEQKFGYPPFILDFFTNDPNNIQMNHSTYVYEVDGKWGYMSDTKDFISPKYDSVEELAADWMSCHGSPNDDGQMYVKWMLIDLRNLYKSRGDWRTIDGNIQLYMWDVIKSGTAIS